jgi:transcriptional regulator with XRE-family HTH domain
VEVAVRFGKNLARCRKRTELSQEDLADRASLHRTAVGHIERGTRLPRVDTLVKLAGALAISPAELLDGIAWEPSDTGKGRFAIAAVAGKTQAK